jgi:hypothetical protein
MDLNQRKNIIQAEKYESEFFGRNYLSSGRALSKEYYLEEEREDINRMIGNLGYLI